MTEPDKFVLQFGPVSLTLTPADIEAALDKWGVTNPNREPTSDEFAQAVMDHMLANAKLIRTVFHD